MPELIGKHYLLIESGARSGGSATVRQGVDVRNGQQVAVKFVNGPSDAITKKVFERETRALRALKHPNIVGFRDAGIDDTGTYFVVLDWVDRNLTNLIDESPWRDWEQLYDGLVRLLLEGLSYAHLNQLEHRDIKPANILINDDGSPLVADFGIAKIQVDEPHSELTVRDFRSGVYAPPERDAAIPYVRDVYSVGVVLLQCLNDVKIRDFPDIRPALESAQLPTDVRALIASCVNPEPTERPANATELLSAFKELTAHRVVGREQARNPIALSLTRTAQDHLAGEPLDYRRAADCMHSDLSGEVFAGFGIDPESGQRDRKRIHLIGSEHRYTLIDDPAAHGFKVIAAPTWDFERLEGARRHSLSLPKIFTWAPIQTSISASQINDRARERLIELVDEFYEARDNPGDESADHAGDELFDLWDRVLDARDDLSRGEHKPMVYQRLTASNRRVTFDLNEPSPNDLVGTQWEVVDRQSEWRYANGEVIDQYEDKIVILFSKQPRNLPQSASLVPFNQLAAISLNRQREAVLSVKSGTSPSRNLRSILVDPGTNTKPSAHHVSEWGSDLDISKRKAVELALGAEDALVVQGPPGTGKTRFIAETVMQFLKQYPEAKVLIASQTHVAVDNAVERLHAAGVSGLVRLAGADESTVQPAVRHLLLDRQRRKWVSRIRGHADASLAERARALMLSPDHVRAALALEQLVVVSTRLEAVTARLRAQTDPSLSSPPSTVSTVLGELDDAEGLQARVDQLRDRHEELVKDVQKYLAGDLTIPQDMSSTDARNAIDALLGSSVSARELLKRLELQASWLEEIAVEEGLTSIFLAGTSVVAGTCTGFLRTKPVRQLEFDLCIVDEASKATFTEALIPMARSKRWILVGDTRQLPPMDEELLRADQIMKDNNLRAEDVRQTLFQRLVDRLPGHSQLTLQDQYRMVRPIGDLISVCFYDSQLRSPKTVGIEGYNLVMGATVTWIDTGPLGNSRRESGSPSFANRAEAELLLKQLDTIDNALQHGLMVAPDPAPLEVLVIAPYKKQVEDLRRRLAPRSFRNLDVTVLSVDAVQGREADLALFSLTRSNTARRLGFLGAEYWRRINVALSRARFGLTIIGDAQFIRETNGALRSVLEYIESHPADCTVREADRG
ncbi:AAA domain-containing protein [Gordonia terrae]